MEKLITICLLLAVVVMAQEFTVHIMLDNAQIEEIIFGCSGKATDKYDRNHDVYAPPMGMDSAIVGLKLEGEPQILYRDLRGVSLPQTWKIDCKLGSRPLFLKWNCGNLPKGVVLELVEEGRPPQDMRKFRQLKVSKTSVIEIKAIKQTETK